MSGSGLRWALGCGLLLLSLSSQAPAQDDIRLVAFQYPPLVYRQQQQTGGIATEIVREVFRDLGLNIEIEILPWARALQYLEHGQADGVFTIFRTPQREAFLLYPDEPLIEQTISLYRNSDTPVPFDNDLSSLAGYRVGVTRAVSYGSRFDRAAEQLRANITVVNDEESKFLLLAKRRVDLVISSTGIADFYLHKLGLQQQIAKIPVVIQRVPSYLAFTRKPENQLLLKKFEQALLRLKRSGRYDVIAEQYH